jgi:geranylgeranyl diphosphate synthase type I
MAAEASALRTLEERFGDRLEREIDGWLGRMALEALFSGMMRYQLGTVDERLRPTGRTGGKRFRPMLCLLAAEACGGSAEQALPVAAGIEILHNFSLVHDDIEDHDPDRRHRPTVWKVWGEPEAINAGDGMFAVATRALLALDATPETVLRVTREFGEMALELTRGQFLDMSFETRTDVDRAEYLEMISLKSAAIIAFSTWSGGFVAGAPEATCAALESYGLHLGRAFQIQDDIQGIWGDPRRTGKQPATDVANRKKSLPVLLALERAHGREAEILDAYYRGAGPEVADVVQVLDHLGVRALAAADAREEMDSAMRALSSAQVSVSGRAHLLSLGREVTGI